MDMLAIFRQNAEAADGTFGAGGWIGVARDVTPDAR
jgi:hypothetical protein